MTEKQAELAIILDEIYAQTKRYENVKVKELSPYEVEWIKKEKLSYILIFLRLKLVGVEKFGHPEVGMVAKLRNKIEFFKGMA